VICYEEDTDALVSLYNNDFKHTTLIEIVVSFTRVAKVPLVHSQFALIDSATLLLSHPSSAFQY